MRGRVSRSYWWLVGWMLNVIFVLAWLFIAWLVGNSLLQPVSLFWIIPILVIQFYMKLVIDIKRLHDLNRSGKWAFLYLLYSVPVINMIILLVRLVYLGFVRGEDSRNRYGTHSRTGCEFFSCK